MCIIIRIFFSKELTLRIVSVLQKDSQVIHIPLTQLPLQLTSHITMSSVTTNEQTLTHYYYLKSILYSDALSFHSMFFFCLRILSASCLLRLHETVIVSQTSLVFNNLESFEKQGSGILNNIMPFYWICYFSHDQTGVMSLGQGDHKSRAPFSSYTRGTCYHHGVSLLMLS